MVAHRDFHLTRKLIDHIARQVPNPTSPLPFLLPGWMYDEAVKRRYISKDDKRFVRQEQLPETPK